MNMTGKLFLSVFTAISLSGAAMTFTGCADEKKPIRLTPKKTFFVKGDPLQIFAGTTKDTTIDHEFFKDGETIYLMTESTYKNRVSLQENTDEGSNDYSGMVAFRIENQHGVLKLVSSQFEVTLTFTQTDDNANELEVLEYGTRTVMKIEHISALGNTATIATSRSAGDYKELKILYFAKVLNPVQPKRGNSEASYYFGDGVKVRWEAEEFKHLELCYNGPNQTELLALVQHSYDQWLEALRRPSEKIEIAKNPKPFSDLSQRCIYVIEDYLVNDGDIAHIAATLTVADQNDVPRFIDSDILIFGGEFQKKIGHNLFAPEVRRDLIIAIIHEIGHWFGLGHVDNHIMSVMTYNDLTTTLTPYDVALIRSLYSD